MEPVDRTGFVPCAVQSCGAKVPERNPILDFAAYMNNENLLASLHKEEVREMLNDAPLPTPEPEEKASFQRKGKLMYGSVSTTGYNALRSEFDIEYDNSAEQLLAETDDHIETRNYADKEDQETCEALHCAVVKIYNSRLLEREWRKRIVRDHALIDSKKTYHTQQKLEVPFGAKNLLILLKFMRFLTGPQLDFIIEGILYQISLRQQLHTFINYRNQGIRFKSGIKIYENLNKKHLKNFNDLKFQSIALSDEIIGVHKSSRKSSAPLVLHNLPGYNLLDEAERNLCSNVRIVPETYHNFKMLLISECKKHNGIKLATARQIIKIDVNKTRRMFDLLKEKKLIWLPNT